MERETQAKDAIQEYEDSYGSIDLEKSYSALFELLWYGQMPCNDIRGITSEAKDELSFIKKCYWKGEAISCNAIFQKRPTDRGLCCSFNIESAENVFKESKYKQAITSRQTEDTQNGFDTGEKPNWYIRNEEPVPEAGRKKGLTLIIDGHTDKVASGTVSDNFRGFPIVVDDNDKFPLTALSELIGRPGFESNIKISAVHLEALNETRKYGPDKRNCYFPDEYDLELHQHYSQSNCIFECEIQFAMNCISACNEFGKECDCKNVGNNITKTNQIIQTPAFPGFTHRATIRPKNFAILGRLKSSNKFLKNKFPKVSVIIAYQIVQLRFMTLQFRTLSCDNVTGQISAVQAYFVIWSILQSTLLHGSMLPKVSTKMQTKTYLTFWIPIQQIEQASKNFLIKDQERMMD